MMFSFTRRLPCENAGVLPARSPRIAVRGFSSRKISTHAAIVLGFFLVGLLAQAARADSDWTLTSAQFQTSHVRLSAIDAAGLHIASQEGAAPALAWDQVLELSRPFSGVAPAAGKYDLYLTGGDRLSGAPLGVMNEKLQWQSPALDKIEFAIGRLSAICRSGSAPTALDELRTDDVVRLANGDSAHGIITQITDAGVTLQAGDAAPTLAWDAVTAVLFSTPPGGASNNRRMYRVRFAGDASISVPAISLAGDRLTINLDDKTARTIDLTTVVAIEQVNGPVSWLTSRPPAENIYKPWFSENFPARFDRMVEDGQAIREKYPMFHHGIGCHSYSRLVYSLAAPAGANSTAAAPSYNAFRTQFAVDSDSPLADVTVRILLDDKVAVEKKNVKAGQIYPVQTVPLGNAKTIGLEVDYGENYATQDRFVWLDPALIRDAVAPRP